MKKIALAVCAASALFGASAYNYEFTPVAGYAHSAGRGLNSEGFIGLIIARNIDSTLLSQVELGFDYSPSVGIKYEGKNTDIERYYANLIKGFDVTNWLNIYGLLGLGYEHLGERTDGAKRDSGFAQAGLGFKFPVTDNFALKLEARDLLNFHHGRHTQMYTLGFAVSFDKKEKEMAPAPAPVAPVIGDEDGDGVLDDKDRCPGTPKGVVVDEYGCEHVIRLDLAALFAFDSAKVTPEYEHRIDEVARVLVKNPNYKVILEGNTDSTGPAEYNKKLSLKRANAVAAVLEKQGVSKDRITTVGLGKDNPVASNATKEGRAKNRRVDAKFRK